MAHTTCASAKLKQDTLSIDRLEMKILSNSRHGTHVPTMASSSQSCAFRVPVCNCWLSSLLHKPNKPVIIEENY
jgi:hypothetical protein